LLDPSVRGAAGAGSLHSKGIDGTRCRRAAHTACRHGMNVCSRDDEIADATTVLLLLGSRERPTAEQRLMLALLCDAVYRYEAVRGAVTPSRMQERSELAAWFASTDRSYVFAFESVCDVLDLCASDIRDRIATTTARPARRHRCVGYS
jgi:hypothetical protein